MNFAPIQNKINEPELQTDFNEFCRRMRTKWYFKDEPTKEFSNIPAFSPKSTWMPPNGHPNLEVYLSQIENEVFKIPKEQLGYSNLSKLEWEAIRSLAGDRSIVIKKADKGSCVVVWDRLDYLMEAEKQLKDRKVYQEVRFSENILTDLVEKSNTMFKNLRRKGVISEKELKYFSFEYKKATNLGKLYLLPKIHKRLKNIPGRRVISNCGKPTEKVLEFLDHHLKPVMQSGWSDIKDSGDFLKKI